MGFIFGNQHTLFGRNKMVENVEVHTELTLFNLGIRGWYITTSSIGHKNVAYKLTLKVILQGKFQNILINTEDIDTSFWLP